MAESRRIARGSAKERNSSFGFPGGPQRPEATQPQGLQVVIPAAAIATRARRVLIVDDNKDSAESMMMLAQSWGHEAIVANDGPSALTIALTFEPDMALVDIGLPGMDGYEVARRLRKASPDRDLYLMALTGYGREEDIRLARAAGFNEHLVKPADLEALRRMMASATVGGLKLLICPVTFSAILESRRERCVSCSFQPEYAVPNVREALLPDVASMGWRAPSRKNKTDTGSFAVRRRPGQTSAAVWLASTD